MRGGSLADAKKLAWTYDYSELAPCSFTVCAYRIQVANVSWQLVFSTRYQFLGRAIIGMGYMPSQAVAYISAREGKVTAASYRIYTGKLDGVTLIAGTDSRNALEPYFSASQAAESYRDLYVHSPGGCTFCEAVFVDVTPDARDDERRIAFSYDFGCVAKLGGCKNLEELVPEIEQIKQSQYLKQEKPVSRCDASTIERFARDFGSVLLVVANSTERTDAGLRLYVKVREVLKTPSKASVPDSLVLDLNHRAVPNEDVSASSVWLAFFATDDLQPLVPEIQFKCALVPAAAETLRAARRGIQRSRPNLDDFGYLP